MGDIVIIVFILFAAFASGFGELVLAILAMMLALLVGIVSVFALGGALAAFLTLYLVRDLLLELLPTEMPREIIRSISGFWVGVPIFITPVLAIAAAPHMQQWENWELLLGISVAGYLFAYYRLLTKTTPRCAQWMQFIAERNLTDSEQKLEAQRQTTDQAIQQEIQTYFSVEPPAASPPRLVGYQALMRALDQGND
jgi:hypothetical protein